MKPRRTRGLVVELQGSHRAMLGTLGVMLVLSLLSSGYLLLVSQPAVESYTDLVREARVVQLAMSDQESGLRGWLATGDEDFLSSYDTRSIAADESVVRLVSGVRGDATLTSGLVDLLVARAEWQVWAETAVLRDADDLANDPGEVSDVLQVGKSLFGVYRDADARVTGTLVTRRDAALDDQWTALAAVLGANLLILGLTLHRAVRRKQRLARTLLGPISGLLGTIDTLRSGDLTARSQVTGVVELDAVGAELDALAADLAHAQRAERVQAARLTLLASRLETVVRVAREVSGSLSVRYVAEAVSTAASDLLTAPTVLWVRDREGRFLVAHRSDLPHGRLDAVERRPMVPDLVTTTADNARPGRDGVSVSYPLVLAGMVVAVLQVDAPDADPATEQVLDALLSTAAAALEAARLHSAADELSRTDALTHLPNRRQLESDLELEWDRSRRYGSPMSFLMVDLDHFKWLNDQHGHTQGDAVLRAVGFAIRGVLRASDTAYRYGGEELAVLLRETDSDAAVPVAERIRAAVAAVRVTSSSAQVTASLGLAERTSAMTSRIELVAAADVALYAAKDAGRDRLVVHPGEPAATAADVASP